MSTRTRVLIAVGGVVIAAIVVFLLGKVIQTHKTETVALKDPVTAVVIDLPSGKLNLIDGAAVTVTRKSTYVVSKPSASEKVKDGTLNIKASCGGLRLGACSVDYVVTVPANVPVRVKTNSGLLTARGLRADLHATSSSGAFNIDDSYGLIDLVSKSGATRGTAVSSRNVTVHSDSGAVELKFAASPNTVDTVTRSGDIHVTIPKSSTTYQVQAGSQSGETISSVARSSSSPYTITAKSDSGDVRVDTSK